MTLRMVCVVFGLWLVCAGNVLGAAELKGKVTLLDKVGTVREKASVQYHVMRAKKPPVLDGKLDEWQQVPGIVLNRKDQSCDSWDGPDDLSGTLRMLWDEAGMYFSLDVNDDVFSAPKQIDVDTWENDSCQIAFDSFFDGPEGDRGEDDLEFCLSQTAKGPMVFKWHPFPTAKLPNDSVKIVPKAEGGCVYEWFMPWSALKPVSPWFVGRCGFTFSINDNDGKGFEGGLQWTRGILHGKDVGAYGEVVFDGALGGRRATIVLPVEKKVADAESRKTGLILKGVEPFETARVLVLTKEAENVSVAVTVYPTGSSVPAASGLIEHRLGPGQMAAFSWDLTTLPDGSYQIVFSRSGVDVDRISYRRVDLRDLQRRAAELRDKFALDRPGDVLDGAPALIRRHRGMMAWGLWLMEREEALKGEDRDEALAILAKMISTIDGGSNYLDGLRGQFWCAYYSSADGSGQPFVVAVPPSFDPEKTYPLIVKLHGGGGRPIPKPNADIREDCLEVQPWGRGDTGYTGLGGYDVLEVIKYMRRWYKIDPDRVYLTGSSMGGRGTWTVATRRADLFAGAGPVYGWADDLHLENLRNVPIFNQHGAVDWIVSIDQSRYAVDRLQRLGYTVAHKEYPNAGHGIDNPYPIPDWFMTLRRDPSPKAITWVTEYPENGGAYWLSVRRLDDPHLPARVKASVTGPSEHQFLTLKLENVAVLELDVAKMPVDPKAGLIVQIGKVQHEVPAGLGEKLFVVTQQAGLRIVSDWSPENSDTRPYRNGAAANLYTGEPLLVVYGTKGGKDRTAMLRKAAESISEHCHPRRKMAVGRFPIKPDTDVTDDDIRRFNLILLGGAEHNHLVSRMAEKLPFKINATNELLAGRRTPVSLARAGYRLFYYNPLDPDRLVFILATDVTGEKAGKWYGNIENLTGLAADHRVDQGDLVVQTIGGADRRRMQFTHGWAWREIPGADIPAPKEKASSKEFRLALLAAIHETARTDFAFFWGPRKDEKSYEPQWFTLADMATQRTPVQILIGELTGDELIDIHQRWIAKGEVLVVPGYEPIRIEPKRIYTIAMPPHLCWKFRERKKNLRNVQAGPDCRPEDMWAKIFGGKARFASGLSGAQ